MRKDRLIAKSFRAWRERTFERLKVDTYAVYLACRDPRVPWYAKALAVCVVGYAFSPIDLIPDPIPILGYLDDLILVPLGIVLVLKMIPEPVFAECRQKAEAMMEKGRPTHWTAAAVVIAIWLMGIVLVLSLIRGKMSLSSLWR